MKESFDGSVLGSIFCVILAVSMAIVGPGAHVTLELAPVFVGCAFGLGLSRATEISRTMVAGLVIFLVFAGAGAALDSVPLLYGTCLLIAIAALGVFVHGAARQVRSAQYAQRIALACVCAFAGFLITQQSVSLAPSLARWMYVAVMLLAAAFGLSAALREMRARKA